MLARLRSALLPGPVRCAPSKLSAELSGPGGERAGTRKGLSPSALREACEGDRLPCGSARGSIAGSAGGMLYAHALSKA